MRLAAAPPVAYASVAAIAIWGMTRTQVVVDEAGTALRQPTAGLNANQLAHLVMTDGMTRQQELSSANRYQSSPKWYYGIALA
jgi:hypothetical protein